MNYLSSLEKLKKVVERNTKNEELYRTILFITKEEDNKMYDYFDWLEKQEFNEVDKTRYNGKDGFTVFVNAGYGFVPPNCTREDYG